MAPLFPGAHCQAAAQTLGGPPAILPSHLATQPGGDPHGPPSSRVWNQLKFPNPVTAIAIWGIVTRKKGGCSFMSV